mgnify:CR=1 FL=1
MQPSETIARSAQQRVRAADGDSFSIEKTKLRLRGIDAPELNQDCIDQDGTNWACGNAARHGLAALLNQPGLRCEISGYDRFGRGLAICKTAQTADIAASQILHGYAISQEFNGVADYGKEQNEARAAKRGIWRGRFINPRLWRERHHRPGPTG